MQFRCSPDKIFMIFIYRFRDRPNDYGSVNDKRAPQSKTYSGLILLAPMIQHGTPPMLFVFLEQYRNRQCRRKSEIDNPAKDRGPDPIEKNTHDGADKAKQVLEPHGERLLLFRMCRKDITALILVCGRDFNASGYRIHLIRRVRRKCYVV